MNGRLQKTAGATSESLAKSFSEDTSAGISKHKSYSRPFSIRLSDDERSTLEQAAGSTPLGAYVRGLVLGVKPRRAAVRRPVADTVTTARVLALLGGSQLGPTMADLGAAARLGVLEMTPDLQAQIQAACADIREVRTLLLRAMGLSAGAGP